MKRESLEALGAVPVTVRLEQAREQLPETIGQMTRILVDNPKPFLLMACGSYVLSGAIINVVKPRGVLGILACGVVSASLGAAVSAELIKRGIMEIRVRDDHGCLVPMYRDDA